MTDYKVIRKEFSKLKGRLTRAKNSGDPKAVVDAVNHAEKVFEDNDWPLPDCWRSWTLARDDASDKLRRSSHGT